MRQASFNKALRRICETKKEGAGKKVVQKLMYFIERSGLDMDLDYCLHFYGPYSVELDEEIYYLTANHEVKIDIKGNTHVISVNDDFGSESISNEDEEIIETVMKRFGGLSPTDLEALATIDYVHIKTKLQGEELINKVLQIKGEKFKIDKLFEYLNTLVNLGYVHL